MMRGTSSRIPGIRCVCKKHQTGEDRKKLKNIEGQIRCGHFLECSAFSGSSSVFACEVRVRGSRHGVRFACIVLKGTHVDSKSLFSKKREEKEKKEEHYITSKTKRI